MPKLSVLKIQREKKTGLHGDGNGLYLQVTRTGSKSWIFRYTLAGRMRSMGLGSVALITLAQAREMALGCRRLLQSGIDPIADRVEAKAKHLRLESSKITFDACCERYIDDHKSGWRNEKHHLQWRNTLRSYASPIFGGLSVDQITTAHVMNALKPIWDTKTETASRLRSRIELILSWAKVHGFRSGENPARWRGHLDMLLPTRASVQKAKHHPAASLSEIGPFVANLRSTPGVSARALEFVILTATRTSETLCAKWNEVDFEQDLWIIPAERMKAGVEHRVPLSPRVLEILREMQRTHASEYLFPGQKSMRPLSNMALLALLRRFSAKFVTHGLRSTFRDWCAEYTNYPREVCEQALAHTLKDKVESAYRRSDLLLKRRALMNEWAKFCNSRATASPTEIIKLNPVSSAESLL